tara:strand:+ start:808 stop:2724 length:1917 start_codon:yes stop_codon:yes gene_type:complete
MPSTVYKGDLAEVSFAPEVGLQIRIGTDSASDAGLQIATVAGNGFTTLTFKAEVNTTLFEAGTHKLRFPKNMLVGSQLVFTANDAAGSNDIDTQDLVSNGRVFTIVENGETTIKITPEMITNDITTVDPGNVLEILPYKTPPIDVGMEAGNATESCKIDQFLGLTSALTLPETKVDLKRYHVVGLGRDTAVQVPGKFITEGGSFEVAMHSARWLKYCLGHELIHSPNGGSVATTLSQAVNAGQSSILVASKSGIAVNDYIEIRDDTPIVPVVSDHEPDGGTWDGTLTDLEFDNAKPSEARRVIGISENDNTLYLDEPLLYPHDSGTDVEVRDPDTSGSLPVTVSSTGTITNPVTHLLFSRSTQPSFCLEVSQRRRDMDTDESTTDGGSGDTKELTRVYRGCKVTDFTMSTDNDAALRLSVNFNSALCYTDTGRLEASPITRYASHRMFDDTAATEQGRINSGIAKGTQKPFMFYNGSINIAGQQVAQVLNFNLTGQTGMQGFHTINGQYQTSSATTDQVPFAGARNTSIMVEGQTSYEMTMEIIVDDPVFFHKMRTGTEFSVNGEGNSTTNQIRISFEKNLTGNTASGASEKMILLIDDYYIVEAPLQIPEDKGAVKSVLKIMPKAIKVLARDTIPKY